MKCTWELLEQASMWQTLMKGSSMLLLPSLKPAWPSVSIVPVVNEPNISKASEYKFRAHVCVFPLYYKHGHYLEAWFWLLHIFDFFFPLYFLYARD